MIRSFLTITFRILWRNKVTSFVNIFSLSVGIAAFIFIMLYVQHETSYDTFNEKYDRIYRLEADGYAKLPPLFGHRVKDNLPEVENVAFIAMNFKNFISYRPNGHPELTKQIEVNRVYADSTTFSIFSFPFIAGNPNNALTEPMTCVFSKSTADKLFGNIDPIGQVVDFEEEQFRVTGIIQDVELFHMEFDMLISLSSFDKQPFAKERNTNMGVHSWTWSATYLLAAPGVKPDHLEQKVNAALSELNDGKLVDIEFQEFQLRPLGDIYFNDTTTTLSYGLHGNLRNITILVFVGLFLLMLACVNYINLTTARSAVRTKEIAIKRLTGSSGRLVRLQLIGESIIITLISMSLAFTFVQLYLPRFNQLISVQLQTSDWNRPSTWVILLIAGVLLGALAGLYPAIYFTAVKPVGLVKGESFNSSRGSGLRNYLMVFQFTMSLVMIIAMLVNFRQLNFLRTADLGFNKAQIVTLITPDGDPNRYAMRQTFKKNLLQHAGIERVTYCTGFKGFPGNVNPIELPPIEVNGIEIKLKAIAADEDYLKVMGISLLEGSNFSISDQPAQPNTYQIILNQTAVKEFEMNDPIGHILRPGNSGQIFEVEVIGVVKDFHISSFHERIEPVALIKSHIPNVGMEIKISASNVLSTIQKIEAEWKKVWNDEPFQYSFLDENFNLQYQRDEQVAIVIGYFTLLAVIIACLGLFALSSFMVSRRVKEIGVRKVLGASVATIYSMLSWDFMKWILMAIVIATPLAWFLMKMWLDTFAYHIELSVDIFVIAALIAIGIALLTVTGQTLKVSRANPVDSLKYE
ncbi:MAG: ABC transporter permease [Bacteroidetes bacterium CHB5]|nr:ABC transporter permease [Bacteroidetes bacterium CHB5]